MEAEMAKVKVAVVGLYFGTIPVGGTIATGKGVLASKFREAPEVDIGDKASPRQICTALSHKIALGLFPLYDKFSVTTSNAGFINKIEVGIPKSFHGLEPGTYSITDSASMEPGIPSPTGYKIAWQTYFFDRNFDQKNTDGTTKSFDEIADWNDGLTRFSVRRDCRQEADRHHRGRRSRCRRCLNLTSSRSWKIEQKFWDFEITNPKATRFMHRVAQS
jgi:hypothetical protein